MIPIRDPDKIGSIWIPEQAKERVDQGVVKYIGPKVKEVGVGAYVTFSGYSGTLIHIGDPEKPQEPGETLIILPEKFVYAEITDFPQTEVPGLYFRGVDGDYFQATYDQALELMARALSNVTWRRNIIVTPPKPDLNDESTDGKRPIRKASSLGFARPNQHMGQKDS